MSQQPKHSETLRSPFARRFFSRRTAMLALVGIGLSAFSLFTTSVLENRAMAEPASAEPKLAHMVYFTLAEATPENRTKLVEACKKYLTGHPGVTYFSVGTLSDMKREVNDRDFDVALNVVFENRAAHDKYQDSPRHQEFIKLKGLWKKVRVFDSNLEAD